MNIGIVLYPTFGGSGVVATELGKALAKKGHKIHFITYKQPVKLNSFNENLSYHEVNVSNYPLFDYQPYELALASKLVDVVEHEEIDLLHVHYAIPHASAAFMAQKILETKGRRIPFITTLHGTDITLVGKDPSFEPVITFTMNNSTALTAVSESLRNDTLEHFKVQKEINVIPNFICLSDYAKIDTKGIEELKRSIAPNGEKILTHISNFRKVKRVDDVIAVFELVRKKMSAKLLLIGDGPYRAQLEEYCREVGIIEDVKFVGKLKNTEDILALSDLFLLTSEFESFGLAALEAMAAKVPVVSTNKGGLPEVNKHGFSGMLSDVGDVEDMSKNAIYILEDSERHEKFRSNAYLRAKEFEINNILPMYEKLYNETISKYAQK